MERCRQVPTQESFVTKRKGPSPALMQGARSSMTREPLRRVPALMLPLCFFPFLPAPPSLSPTHPPCTLSFRDPSPRWAGPFSCERGRFVRGRGGPVGRGVFDAHRTGRVFPPHTHTEHEGREAGVSVTGVLIFDPRMRCWVLFARCDALSWCRYSLVYDAVRACAYFCSLFPCRRFCGDGLGACRRCSGDYGPQLAGLLPTGCPLPMPFARVARSAKELVEKLVIASMRSRIGRW